MLGWLVIGAAVYFAAGHVIHGPKFWWAMFAVGLGAAALERRSLDSYRCSQQDRRRYKSLLNHSWLQPGQYTPEHIRHRR